MPSEATAAILRATSARSPSRYWESWNECRYSSDVDPEIPPPMYRSDRAATRRPLTGAVSNIHNGASIRRSYTACTATSRPRTNRPVAIPVAAARSTTSRDRRIIDRNSSRRCEKTSGRTERVTLLWIRRLKGTFRHYRSLIAHLLK